MFSILSWSLTLQYNFLLKVDDDVLLHPAGLARLQDQVLDKFRGENKIFGFPVHNSSVHRHGKYSVKEYQHSNFPSFVLGPFYILTDLAVKKIVGLGVDKIDIPLEDVAITGVLRELSGADIVSIKQHVVPSLDYVHGLIHFFGSDMAATAHHLAEYSALHCQVTQAGNISKQEQERIVNWVWTSVWSIE